MKLLKIFLITSIFILIGSGVFAKGAVKTKTQIYLVTKMTKGLTTVNGSIPRVTGCLGSLGCASNTAQLVVANALKDFLKLEEMTKNQRKHTIKEYLTFLKAFKKKYLTEGRPGKGNTALLSREKLASILRRKKIYVGPSKLAKVTLSSDKSTRYFYYKVPLLSAKEIGYYNSSKNPKEFIYVVLSKLTMPNPVMGGTHTTRRCCSLVKKLP